MLPSANSFYVEFTNKPKVTDNLSYSFEEAYTDHRRNLNIIYKNVIMTDVKISEIFYFTVNFLLKCLITFLCQII